MPFLKKRNGERAKRRKDKTVKGHEGKLKFYKIKNQNVLVFSGRRHLYEGLDITEIIKNIQMAYELGTKKIIITNAWGKRYWHVNST